jgi:transcriptional regulator with GAF, ATPase, and Fis domain
MLCRDIVKRSRFHKIVGRSPSTLRLYELIEIVARTKATVLILGESGTGKELVARAIHNQGPRKHKPFVAVNCPATTHHLWESEMFGHEKGAFTGAVSMKRGRFEWADGGTLFLDEVSGMPLALQVKLLRVLQEMEFERVGGTRTINVDVRIIAATNKDLRQGVEEGWFREDLFFRLNVFTIQIPPLRDRRQDIPPLVDHFIEKYAHETGKRIQGVSYDAMEALMSYEYPGNVRELENIVQRAVILAKEGKIALRDLPVELPTRTSGADDPLCRVKAEDLLKALEGAVIHDNGGPPKLWHQSLRSITIETIHEFLLKTNQEPFSRLEFAKFLSYKGKSDRNKYGTAGKYLSVLRENQICVHNRRKANQSRYRLSDAFLGNA